MVTIQIGGNDRTLEDVSDDWIIQQINRRRRDGQNVCVKVVIYADEVNIEMATPGCIRERYPRRRTTRDENNMFDLWDSLGLNDKNFKTENVVKFVNLLRSKF